MKTQNAKKLLKRTQNTMVTFELRIGEQVIDGVRTQEEAEQWVKETYNQDPEYFDSIDDKPNYNAILIDDNNGNEITLDNIVDYLDPIF